MDKTNSSTIQPGLTDFSLHSGKINLKLFNHQQMLAPTLYDSHRKSYKLTSALRDLWARVMFRKSSKVDNFVPRVSLLCLLCR